MNILFVYPKYPETYWSFSNVLKFISKKAAVPPLGLITVSALLPSDWQKKLIDLNVESINEEDIVKADYVFLSAMYVQKESVAKVISLCKKHKVKIIAGGPLFTQEYKNYPEIDHFILNEAEITLPLFLKDLELGNPLKRVYHTTEHADLTTTPVPDYHLLSRKDYVFMNIQVTRGCPFNCDFCEITSLLGHKVRMKNTQQILDELTTLYNLNWRGPVAIVDDNFIGNKKEVKTNLIPAMKKWMIEHNHPFVFNTQSSINLADDPELLAMMVDTGFSSTFIGIETPDEDSLKSCNKVQNRNRDLLNSVIEIQKAGMQVSAGFIVGFDSDTSTVFQRQTDFIQKSGIVSAMVGLLNAPKNTVLYNRMEQENRLTIEATGDNTDFSMNFTPKMDSKMLLEGYNSIIKNIYNNKPYYKRIRQFLKNYQPKYSINQKVDITHIKAFIKSMFIIGVVKKGRWEYWKFMIWTLFNKPKLFVDAITFVVYGYHFRSVYKL